MFNVIPAGSKYQGLFDLKPGKAKHKRVVALDTGKLCAGARHLHFGGDYSTFETWIIDSGDVTFDHPMSDRRPR
jgi:hypothetical protein